MGYRIRYPSVNCIREKTSSHFRLYTLTSLFLLIFGATTFLFWPEGRSVFQNILIPGDPQKTIAAFQDFLQSITNGVSFSEAVKVFCTGILEGAGVAAY